MTSREELQQCLKDMVTGQWNAQLENVKAGLFRLPQQQRHLLLMVAGGWTQQDIVESYRLRDFPRTLRRAEDALLSALGVPSA